MGFLEWAIDPWGLKVPIHIASFLIWVAVITGLAFFIAHATYLRYFAKPRQFAPEIPPPSLSEIPEHVPRHSQVARMFHWIMAAAMFTLLFTAFLPKVGVQFPWVTYHWIAGTVLTLSILFHILHASFWLDFWSIWPDRIDVKDAIPQIFAFYGTIGAAAQKVRQISTGEQALPWRHHRNCPVGDHHRRVDDVSRTHDLLYPQPISFQRYELGHDLRAAWSGGRRADLINHDAHLFRASAGEAPDHEVDDLRLDESRVLSGGVRPRAVGCQSAECGAAAHRIEGWGLTDAGRNPRALQYRRRML